MSRLDFGDRTFAGNALILTNCLCYSIFLVLSRDILRRHSAIRVTAAVFRYAAIPIVLVAIPDLLRFRPATLTSRAWTGIAGTIVFATIIAYALTRARRWGPGRRRARSTASRPP